MFCTVCVVIWDCFKIKTEIIDNMLDKVALVVKG